MMSTMMSTMIWLVVWTPLKNISQLGWLFLIYGKMPKMATKPPTSDSRHRLIDFVGSSEFWTTSRASRCTLGNSLGVVVYCTLGTWTASSTASCWGTSTICSWPDLRHCWRHIFCVFFSRIHLILRKLHHLWTCCYMFFFLWFFVVKLGHFKFIRK